MIKYQLYLLLLFFFSVCFFATGQSDKVVHTWETLLEYKESEKTYDLREYENCIICYDDDDNEIARFWANYNRQKLCDRFYRRYNDTLSLADKKYVAYLGKTETEYNNLYRKWFLSRSMLMGGFGSIPILMSKSIDRIDKRDFAEFEDLVLRKLPQFFSEYSETFNWKNEFAIYYDKINFEFVTGDSNRAIAWADSPMEGDIRIIVNIDEWEELNNYERVYLLIHELGHEAFGMEHGDNRLMYPLMPYDELLKDGKIEKWELEEIRNNVGKERIRHEINSYKSDVYIDEHELFGWSLNNGKPLKSRKFYDKIGFRRDYSIVPIAFNVLFNDLIDFYNYLSTNKKFRRAKVPANFFIRETGVEIERIVNYYVATDSDGKYYEPDRQ